MIAPEAGSADLERLARAAAALEDLGQALGQPPDYLSRETRDQLSFEGHVRPEALAAISAIAPRLADLGTALHAVIRVGDLDVLQIGPATGSPEVAEARNNLAGQQGTLDLQVDKEVLCRELGFLNQDSDVALFLSSAALIRELDRSLPDLDAGLLRWTSDARKLVVVVAGCSVSLDGDHFAIVGTGQPDAWEGVAPRQAPSDARILAFRQLALPSAVGPGTVNWLGFELGGLTPVHLALDRSRQPEDDDGLLVNARLLRVQSLLAIAYTATQVVAPISGTPPTSGVERDDRSWIATYAADGKTARLSWRHPQMASQSVQVGIEPGVQTLSHLALWAYSSETASMDRLTVMREVVARELMGNDPRDNYRLLLGQAAKFQQRTSGSWEAFVAGKLDRYFGRVRELEQAVDATVEAASEQVEGLTKGLIDSALAAVGVIVASFLAAVLKDKFDLQIYRLGVTAYAIYLLLFPGLVGLSASAQRFRALDRGLDERRRAFSHRLSEDEVTQTIGDGFIRLAHRFWTWFTIAALVYASLAALLLWSRSGVPSLLAGHQTAPSASQVRPAAIRSASSVPPSKAVKAKL